MFPMHRPAEQSSFLIWMIHVRNESHFNYDMLIVLYNSILPQDALHVALFDGQKQGRNM